jgi:hypothetical protein
VRLSSLEEGGVTPMRCRLKKCNISVYSVVGFLVSFGIHLM